MSVLPKCEPIILTKKQLEEEIKRSKARGEFGYPWLLPVIQIPPKKKKKEAR